MPAYVPTLSTSPSVALGAGISPAAAGIPGHLSTSTSPPVPVPVLVPVPVPASAASAAATSSASANNNIHTVPLAPPAESNRRRSEVPIAPAPTPTTCIAPTATAPTPIAPKPTAPAVPIAPAPALAAPTATCISMSTPTTAIPTNTTRADPHPSLLEQRQMAEMTAMQDELRSLHELRAQRERLQAAALARVELAELERRQQQRHQQAARVVTEQAQVRASTVAQMEQMEQAQRAQVLREQAQARAPTEPPANPPPAATAAAAAAAAAPTGAAPMEIETTADSEQIRRSLSNSSLAAAAVLLPRPSSAGPLGAMADLLGDDDDGSDAEGGGGGGGGGGRRGGKTRGGGIQRAEVGPRGGLAGILQGTARLSRGVAGIGAGAGAGAARSGALGEVYGELAGVDGKDGRIAGSSRGSGSGSGVHPLRRNIRRSNSAGAIASFSTLMEASTNSSSTADVLLGSRPPPLSSSRRPSTGALAAEAAAAAGGGTRIPERQSFVSTLADMGGVVPPHIVAAQARADLLERRLLAEREELQKAARRRQMALQEQMARQRMLDREEVAARSNTGSRVGGSAPVPVPTDNGGGSGGSGGMGGGSVGDVGDVNSDAAAAAAAAAAGTTSIRREGGAGDKITPAAPPMRLVPNPRRPVSKKAAGFPLPKLSTDGDAYVPPRIGSLAGFRAAYQRMQQNMDDASKKRKAKTMEHDTGKDGDGASGNIDRDDEIPLPMATFTGDIFANMIYNGRVALKDHDHTVTGMYSVNGSKPLTRKANEKAEDGDESRSVTSNQGHPPQKKQRTTEQQRMIDELKAQKAMLDEQLARHEQAKAARNEALAAKSSANEASATAMMESSSARACIKPPQPSIQNLPIPILPKPAIEERVTPQPRGESVQQQLEKIALLEQQKAILGSHLAERVTPQPRGENVQQQLEKIALLEQQKAILGSHLAERVTPQPRGENVQQQLEKIALLEQQKAILDSQLKERVTPQPRGENVQQQLEKIALLEQQKAILDSQLKERVTPQPRGENVQQQLEKIALLEQQNAILDSQLAAKKQRAARISTTGPGALKAHQNQAIQSSAGMVQHKDQLETIANLQSQKVQLEEQMRKRLADAGVNILNEAEKVFDETSVAVLKSSIEGSAELQLEKSSPDKPIKMSSVESRKIEVEAVPKPFEVRPLVPNQAMGAEASLLGLAPNETSRDAILDEKNEMEDVLVNERDGGNNKKRRIDTVLTATQHIGDEPVEVAEDAEQRKMMNDLATMGKRKKARRLSNKDFPGAIIYDGVESTDEVGE